jgi:hypothetical protein
LAHNSSQRNTNNKTLQTVRKLAKIIEKQEKNRFSLVLFHQKYQKVYFSGSRPHDITLCTSLFLNVSNNGVSFKVATDWVDAKCLLILDLFGN